MTIKVGINGYGRIGRSILRALYEQKRTDEIEVVALNNTRGALEAVAHLTKYDSTHGIFPADISFDDEHLIVNNDRISVLNMKDPAQLPWKKLGVDLVFECTGKFNARDKAKDHLAAGAKKVLISAPAKDADATIVYGVNDGILTRDHQIISNASCTTNCLAPLVKPLHEKIGIENGLMTTIHAYTNDQVLSDSYHKDMRRARSAAVSMIPTSTGAAAAVGLVLPELSGRLDGFAIRVPVNNVSLVDLTFVAKRTTSVKEINQVVKAAAESELTGVLEYTEEPLVSIDFNHNSASSIFDSTETRVIGKMVKVLSWYDNEWGFSNRMLDTAIALMNTN